MEKVLKLILNMETKKGRYFTATFKLKVLFLRFPKTTAFDKFTLDAN